MESDYEFFKDKSFPIKFSHQKIIVELSNLVYLIIFVRNISTKDNYNFIDHRDKPKPNKQIYIELLIVIKRENSNKNNFIKDLEEKDMNKWIKDLNIDIDINNDKLYHKNDIYFKIINKTLKSHQKNISPNLQEVLAKEMIKNFQIVNNENNENNNIIYNPLINVFFLIYV